MANFSVLYNGDKDKEAEAVLEYFSPAASAARGAAFYARHDARSHRLRPSRTPETYA